MNMFENYYGKPQGNVNLYGFNLPLEYYNCLWKEDDKTHTQPLVTFYKGQEVIPKRNATDLVDKIYKLCNVINRSVGDLNQKNSHIEFLENQLQKYISNEDKKNELSLANNDVIKNNQEMEKIHENREDRLFKIIDEKVEERMEKEINQMKKINNKNIKLALNDIEILLELVENKDDKVYKIIKNRYCKGDE